MKEIYITESVINTNKLNVTIIRNLFILTSVIRELLKSYIN